MDFTNLKQKFFDTTKIITSKAKELGNKALEVAGDTITKTPLIIENDNDFKDFTSKKRAIVIAYEENSDIEKELLLLLPVWQAEAFIDVAALGYLTPSKSNDIIKTYNFSLPVEMKIYTSGDEIQSITSLEEIKAWWKKREYTLGTTNASQKVSDPLASENFVTTNTPQEQKSDVDVSIQKPQDPIKDTKETSSSQTNDEVIDLKASSSEIIDTPTATSSSKTSSKTKKGISKTSSKTSSKTKKGISKTSSKTSKEENSESLKPTAQKKSPKKVSSASKKTTTSSSKKEEMLDS